MQTRSQKYSQMAYEHISQLDLNEAQKKLYGSICHEFPIMVLRSGLAQAVAFIRIKSESNNKAECDQKVESGKKAESNKIAYKEFLRHLSSITGQDNEYGDAFQVRIQKMELGDYLRTTRTLLNAAVWYKRFAESLLNVKAGANPSDIEQAKED